ncbi:hypothetical protein D3C87_1643560 [compost metagenome]
MAIRPPKPSSVRVNGLVKTRPAIFRPPQPTRPASLAPPQPIRPAVLVIQPPAFMPPLRILPAVPILSRARPPKFFSLPNLPVRLARRRSLRVWPFSSVPPPKRSVRPPRLSMIPPPPSPSSPSSFFLPSKAISPPRPPALPNNP